jgi:hypothetical protein
MRDRSTATEDNRTERRVLYATLDAYPELLTESDLVYLLVENDQDFPECDAVRRAVSALCGVRLLVRCRPLVIPSYAALRFNALEQAEPPL